MHPLTSIEYRHGSKLALANPRPSIIVSPNVSKLRTTWSRKPVG